MNPSYHLTDSIPSHVFRTNDIRGIVDTELNENSFYTIGCALGHKLNLLKKNTAVVGFDCRNSSKNFTDALVAGLLYTGIDVIDIGMVPTPLLYFAVEHFKATSGVMITASHNPAEYNGLKIIIENQCAPIHEIRDICSNINLYNLHREPGTVTCSSIDASYLLAVCKQIKPKRKMRAVVDCGNGVAGPVTVKLLENIGVDVIPLYCSVDGSFPNHHPDPSKVNNLKDLIAAVVKSKSDLGLAIDGDGDRVVMIDDKGQIIWPDRLLMLLSQDFLSKSPDSSIVFDIKCSRHLNSLIKASGGKPVVCPTGHAIVKKTMHKHNAILGGEMSGHLFLKDRWYGFDDALYASCRLIEILSSCGESVSTQFKKFPDSINTPELNIPIKENQKSEFIKRIKDNLIFHDSNNIYIDGVRCEFPFGWGLIRASNTSANLVLRFEADNSERLDYLKNLFKEKLLGIDKSLNLPF